MGIVNFGIPIEDAKYLQRKMGLNVAVESGTYLGETAKSLSEIFEQVYTIENSDQMFVQAKKNIAGIGNISLLKGDTRDHLPEILMSEDNILFWLDAHWSGGVTYGEQDECPLRDELVTIFQSEKVCAILIDDARLFIAPPPSPHNERSWPSVADISAAIPSDWDVIIYKDVIYITPKSIGFRQYIQVKTTSDWLALSKRKHPSFGKNLRGLFRAVVRR
jgi:hypothetical protein